jgi:signal transduction histidine kinase
MNDFTLGLIGSAVLNNLKHFDLVAVGIAVAAIGILGFIVFFSDRQSSTNRTFLAFALATIAYGSVNYFSYQATGPILVLWLLRLTLFTAVWHAFSFFSLFLVFPRTKITWPWWYLFAALPAVIITSILTLTPLVFSKIDRISTVGRVTNPERGPAIIVFGIVSAFLVFGGLIQLIRKASWGSDVEKKQARVVLIGAVMTFSLILTFNLVLPVVLNILTYIPFAPVFMLPFITFTAHAIRKYRLLNVKILTTEVFTFALALTTLIEVLFAKDVLTLLVRLTTFGLVLGFGILLIQSVIHEVHQREQLNELTAGLQQANTRLTQLDHLKSQFLSFASHQIKSPLTTVKWRSQLIADGGLGIVPPEVVGAAREIKESVERVSVLVDEFLDLHKIQEGRMDFQFESTDIPLLVQKTTNDLSILAKKKGLTLSYTDRTTKRIASVDPQKFSQVVQNFLDNSIKYTDKGSITVTVENETPESITISVQDTGHGLNPELIPHLFEQFMRSREDMVKIEGTGLGLYIAKQIVTAHRGIVWASSPGPGKGSTFAVRIPTV